MTQSSAVDKWAHPRRGSASAIRRSGRNHPPPRGPKTLLAPGNLDLSGPINIAGSPHIRGEFLNNGIRIFQTQMHEREAFRVIFSFGGTVEALNTEQVSNLDAAVKNQHFSI